MPYCNTNGNYSNSYGNLRISNTNGNYSNSYYTSTVGSIFGFLMGNF